MILSITHSPFFDYKSSSLQANSIGLNKSEHSQGDAKKETPTEHSSNTASNIQGLTADQIKQITTLKARDIEVKAHEQAHLSAAGQYALGGASFNFQTGPDGVSYAIGGEVKIDTSVVPGDPAATLRKADIIMRAALAPAEPSGQDIAVAASATAMAAKAQAELAKTNQEQLQNSTAADSATRGTETKTIPNASGESDKPPDQNQDKILNSLAPTRESQTGRLKENLKLLQKLAFNLNETMGTTINITA